MSVRKGSLSASNKTGARVQCPKVTGVLSRDERPRPRVRIEPGGRSIARLAYEVRCLRRQVYDLTDGLKQLSEGLLHLSSAMEQNPVAGHFATPPPEYLGKKGKSSGKSNDSEATLEERFRKSGTPPSKKPKKSNVLQSILSEVRSLKKEVNTRWLFDSAGAENEVKISEEGTSEGSGLIGTSSDLRFKEQGITSVVKSVKRQAVILSDIHRAMVNHSLEASNTLAYVEKRIDIKQAAMEALESKIISRFDEKHSTVVVDTPEMRAGLAKMVEALVDDVLKQVESRSGVFGKLSKSLTDLSTAQGIKSSLEKGELSGTPIHSGSLERLVADVSRCVNLLESKYSVTPGPVETAFKSIMTSAFGASGTLALLGGATTTIETGGIVIAGLRLFGTAATVLNPGAIAGAGTVGLVLLAANIYGMLHGIRVPELFKRFARAKQEKGYVNPFATLRLGTPSFLGTGASVGLSLRDPKTFDKEMFYAWDGNVLSIARFADDLLRVWLDKDLDLRDLRARKEKAQTVVDNSIKADLYQDMRPPTEIRPERRATKHPDGTEILQEFGPAPGLFH